jgi:hypothetical protein
MAAELDKPIGAITAQDHHHLVAAHTVKFYGTSTGTTSTSRSHGDRRRWKHGVVAASLLRTTAERRPASDTPLGTLDAKIATRC